MRCVKIGDEIIEVCACCCLLIIGVFLFGALTGGSEPSNSNINVVNDLNKTAEKEDLNMTNVTVKSPKFSFVYYDHNSSKWDGCYGLNYSVLKDNTGNSYMFDHATTDLIGENTNYAFKYPHGIILVFDNNTETDIYNSTGLYYVHEVQDDNGTVIKSKGNFTLNDKSHEPDIIPGDWLFVYRDHNSSHYEGDEGLEMAVTTNKIGKNEVLHFEDVRDIIGLAYYTNKNFNYYKYGLSGIEIREYGSDEHPYYTAVGTKLHFPNGTLIRTFDITSHNLIQKEKDFITNYANRIDDVRLKQQIDAMDAAEDDLYTSYVRSKEHSSSKYGTYIGSNGYGVFHMS